MITNIYSIQQWLVETLQSLEAGLILIPEVDDDTERQIHDDLTKAQEWSEAALETTKEIIKDM